MIDPVIGTRFIPLNQKPERSCIRKVNRWLENNTGSADDDVFIDSENFIYCDATKSDNASLEGPSVFSLTMSISSDGSNYSEAAKSPNATNSLKSTGSFSHITKDNVSIIPVSSDFSKAATSINATNLPDDATDRFNIKIQKILKRLESDFVFRCKIHAKHNSMQSITYANTSCQLCENTRIENIERKVENTLLFGCIVINSFLIALMSPYYGLTTFIILVFIWIFVKLFPNIFASNNDLESIRTSFNQSITITNPAINFFSEDSTHCFSIIFYIKDLFSCLKSKLRSINLTLSCKIFNIFLKNEAIKYEYSRAERGVNSTRSNSKEISKTSEEEISTHFIVTCGFIVTYAWALTMLNSVEGIFLVIILTIAAVFMVAKHPFPECEKKAGSNKYHKIVNNIFDVESSTSSANSEFSQRSVVYSEDKQKSTTLNETNNCSDKDNKSEEIYKVSVGLLLGLFYLVMYYLENYYGNDKN